MGFKKKKKWSLFGKFGKFHFTPKWGNMLDHFTLFRGNIDQIWGRNGQIYK
jgi:hypothetical protein